MARICKRCNHHNEDHAKFCLSCGAMLETTAPEKDADPIIGKVLLGRYRPISVLGEGGMGKVYLAEQKMGTATRKVAIKTLHPELINDPQLVARFQRESETVIELRHPNTIQFYDFGELEDQTLLIVMEFIEGEPLADKIDKQGALPAPLVDKIVIQICGSLHEAHELGIVHRDLKPENVLLTDQGGQNNFVKVLDFGIAKRDDAEDPNQAKLTKQGMVLGTPPYMSPEQFSGQKLDARSDVYSLGVMVYEMVTGHLPFEAVTAWEWATKHLTAEPTPLEHHAAARQLPSPKRQAIMRALAKDRDTRQSGVQEFLKEFTGYQSTNDAWTMATSGAGLSNATPHTPIVRGAQHTPQPMAQVAPISAPGVGHAQASPIPHTGSQPAFPNPHGSAPGIPTSSPGMHSPAPGMHSPAPGFPRTQGMAAYPEANPTTAPLKNNQAVKMFAILGVLFVLFAGVFGTAAYFVIDMNDDDNNEVHVAQQTPATNVPQSTPTTPPLQPATHTPTPTGVMQPSGTMTPRSPREPLVPSTTANTAQPTPTEPNTAQPTPTEPETNARPPSNPRRPTKRPRPRAPSAAEQARARAILATGMGSVRRNDFAGAIGALGQARRLVGRNHTSTRELQGELNRRGSNQIGQLLQQGRCAQAQRLYQQLRRVGAASGARRQFGEWCPAR